MLLGELGHPERQRLLGDQAGHEQTLTFKHPGHVCSLRTVSLFGGARGRGSARSGPAYAVSMSVPD
ncbi:hypothetical protein Afil01_35790 [Actinorhabdospora filicis]|uniref:Uncharacterized protein n=1 Tax=Actinorhabdospora filicis TaxID=1785913 RepID=A0A9W6W416_9ACTN|nr:hypothetical protein Afil01_35790 [Actinorhabdospora filicis]